MFFYVMIRALTKNSKKQMYLSNRLVFSSFENAIETDGMQTKSFFIKTY